MLSRRSGPAIIASRLPTCGRNSSGQRCSCCPNPVRRWLCRCGHSPGRVSPSAIYVGPLTKSDLLAALIEKQFTQLTAAIEGADDPGAAATGRIERACRSYAKWGPQH